MLIVLARQVLDCFDWQLDINELINIGWFRQARDYESVTGRAAYIKREMYKWACKQHPNVYADVDVVDTADVVTRF